MEGSEKAKGESSSRTVNVLIISTHLVLIPPLPGFINITMTTMNIIIIIMTIVIALLILFFLALTGSGDLLCARRPEAPALGADSR